MNRLSAFLSLGLLLVGSALSAVPVATVTAELFPVEPGFDTQRGFAVAVDGDRMAVGAPLDDTVARDAGAVHLFQWIDGRWEPETTLYPDVPQERCRFGAALALHEGVLAVGAPGVGIVYLFRTGQSGWGLGNKVRRQDLMPGFGRSVALGGGRLAVGDAVPAGDGFVFLYDFGLTATVPQLLRVFGGGPGERFGEAVVLAGDGKTLAVGAPGAGAAAGAVDIFAAVSKWKLVRLAGQKAGEQLGAAVALSGDQLAAAGADRLGDSDSTAPVYVFERTGARWSKPVRVLSGAGSALAMDGDLLVAGAAAPFANKTGTVRVLRHGTGGWSTVGIPPPGNSELHDLTGYAVAVSGSRVAIGAVLGDQGGAAAGAAWTFACPPEGDAPCIEEGEAVVRDPNVTQNVGAALALHGDSLAVGVSPPASMSGTVHAVYVYRRYRRVSTGTGWRQEVRLEAPQQQIADNGFGSAVALSDDLLAVGAPRDLPLVSPPLPTFSGSVYVYRRHNEREWGEAVLIPGGQPGEEFGASVAVMADDRLIIGAPGMNDNAGAVAIYRPNGAGWTCEKLLIGDQVGERFGTAVALRNGLLAVGASPAGYTFYGIPRRTDIPAGDGLVKIFSASDWSLIETLQPATPGSAFGAALAFGDRELVVGAPGAGTVYAFEIQGWKEEGNPLGAPPGSGIHFGAAVAVFGDQLVVGAPGDEDIHAGNAGRAWLYQRGLAGWSPAAATPPGVRGDASGAAVAVDDKGFVVASPGASAGDRVTVYALPPGGPS